MTAEKVETILHDYGVDPDYLAECRRLISWEIIQLLLRIEAASRPQIVVWLTSGGILESSVTDGDIEVVQFDWQNIDSEALIDSWSLEDLLEVKRDFESIRDDGLRRSFLEDINAAIDEWKEIHSEY